MLKHNLRDSASKEPKAGKEPKEAAPPDKSASAALSVLRVWTDRTGKFQVQAKFLGVEAGKVKLEKPDGPVVSVPVDRPSEADQRFIGAGK